MLHIAINGFGRIGRNFLRAVLQDSAIKNKLRVVAINIGPASGETTAHMFKYDSTMGTYKGSVTMEGNFLVVDDLRIAIISELFPENIDWKMLNIDWVVECSGKFTQRADAEKHRKAGAHQVLISAPSKDDDITIIPGVNHHAFNAQKHKIVSLGSCTTNAFAPLLQVLHETFTITHGYMTTVHAYTNSQLLLDGERTDLRRARSATLNIIPTTTGAARTVIKVLPELQGLIHANALRIPLAKVSLIDLSFITQKPLSVEGIHTSFEAAAQAKLKGILRVSNEPLVSSDYSGDSHSVIVDSLLTAVQGPLGKVYGWYDNEWAYSVRLKDFLAGIATSL